MLQLAEDIHLSNRKIETILHDSKKSAEAAHLVYVHDNQAGIKRIRKGNSFIYLSGSQKVKDKPSLDRIEKLVIPPAWQNVWICQLDNGHLQVTGIDAKKRKQYKYHPLWNSLRNHTKFHRLHEFGRFIPTIRQQVEKDLARQGLPLEKVLATIVCLMETTSIRIGNAMYEKLYHSYGLTTLKDKHVHINGANMLFVFKGKKGVSQNISVKSKRLAKIVKQCKDISGKELFQYIDENGDHKCVDSGMVNRYLKSTSGEDFTAKDFRTWSGTVHSLMAFKELGICDTVTQAKKNIVRALDMVAKHLGNTRTVCKKYYVHPVIVNLYENKSLYDYLGDLDKPKKCQKNGLTCEEKLLMQILEKEGLTSS
jgi:DNA topoisomerase-1